MHQHLIRKGLRTAVSLVVESGEPREVHHLACLVGMGAEAVNPYLALATVRNLAVERDEVRKGAAGAGEEQDSRSPHELADEAEHKYIHALEKGLLKIMSKIGIATVDSYCGAQIFETIGLKGSLVEQYFTGVPSRLGGIDLRRIAQNVLNHHEEAFSNRPPHVATRTSLPQPGFYKFKKDGEYHSFAPAVVHALQKASGGGDYGVYKSYSDLVHKRPPTELRDLLGTERHPQLLIRVGRGPAAPHSRRRPLHRRAPAPSVNQEANRLRTCADRSSGFIYCPGNSPGNCPRSRPGNRPGERAGDGGDGASAARARSRGARRARRWLLPLALASTLRSVVAKLVPGLSSACNCTSVKRR